MSGDTYVTINKPVKVRWDHIELFQAYGAIPSMRGYGYTISAPGGVVAIDADGRTSEPERHRDADFTHDYTAAEMEEQISGTCPFTGTTVTTTRGAIMDAVAEEVRRLGS